MQKSDNSDIFPELVLELRQKAIKGTGILELLSFLNISLGGPNNDITSSVKIGANTKAVLRLALIFYLRRAFGLSLSMLQELISTIVFDGQKYTTSNPKVIKEVEELIEQKRDTWSNELL